MRHPSVRAAVGGLVLGAAVLAIGATGAVAQTAGPEATGGAAAAKESPRWPQLQGEPQHAGFASGETKLTGQTVDDLQVAWRAPLMRAGEFNDSAPVVVDGTAYAVGREVAAFDAATGTQRWSTPIGGSSFATPAVGDGLVVAGATLSGIVALDAATGAIVWKHQVKSYNSSSITINGDRVFVTFDNGLLALRLQTGKVLWSKTYPACFCMRSTPTFANGLLIVGAGGSAIAAYDATSGALRWSRTLSSGSGNSAEAWLPAVSGNVVYAGSMSGVAALDLRTGKLMWSNTTDVTSVFAPLAVTSSAVLVPSDEGGTLVALDRERGTVLWRNDIAGEAGGISAFGTLMWLVRSDPAGGDGRVEAYNWRTGHRVYSQDLGGVVFGRAPIVVGGHVYSDLGDEVVSLARP
jgi:outer membrane protein assembly factor BamB